MQAEPTDAQIEQAALKHVATSWKQLAAVSNLDPDYRKGEQFKRLKAFALELFAAPVAKEAAKVQAVPEGFVLMPKSPSEAVLAPDGWPRLEYARYQAILAAAPQAPTAQEVTQQADEFEVEGIEPTGDDLYDASNFLLNAAQQFWDECHKVGQYGAVQWLTGSNGELLIYTRGEYREQLMSNIHTFPSQKEKQFPVTQQAAKAKTAEQAEGAQANVLPPTRGTESQLDAARAAIIDALSAHRMVCMYEVEEDGGLGNTYSLIDCLSNDGALDIASGKAEIEAIADAVLDALDDESLARRFRAPGGNTNTESSDLAPTTSTVSASAEYVGKLRSTLHAIANTLDDNELRGAARDAYDLAAPSSTEGTQEAPEEVRNQILDEAAKLVEEFDVVETKFAGQAYDDGARTLYEAAAAIRALRTTSTDTGSAA